MSLICATYVPTSIILAGDSRTTYTLPPAAGTNLQTNIVLSDSANKVFRLFERFASATCGDAIINTLPIAHYIEQFEQQNSGNPPATTAQLANLLLGFFRQLNPIPNTRFLVAGYDATIPWVFSVEIIPNTSVRVNAGPAGTVVYGMYYAGDIAITQRLLSQQQFNPLFNVMNTQDAADFTRHVVRTTIDQLRFEPRFPTVGGPIDTIVLTTKGASWLEKKTLECH